MPLKTAVKKLPIPTAHRQGWKQKHPATPRPRNSPQRMPKFELNDGGRNAAGMHCVAKYGQDCVPRAIAIATGRPYKDVYKELFNSARNYTGSKTPWGAEMQYNIRKEPSPAKGTSFEVMDGYLGRHHGARELRYTRRIDGFPKKGTFLLAKPNDHIMVLKNGTVYDVSDSRYATHDYSTGKKLNKKQPTMIESYYDLRGKLKPKKRKANKK